MIIVHANSMSPLMGMRGITITMRIEAGIISSDGKLQTGIGTFSPEYVAVPEVHTADVAILDPGAYTAFTISVPNEVIENTDYGVTIQLMEKESGVIYLIESPEPFHVHAEVQLIVVDSVTPSIVSRTRLPFVIFEASGIKLDELDPLRDPILQGPTANIILSHQLISSHLLSFKATSVPHTVLPGNYRVRFFDPHGTSYYARTPIRITE